MKNWCFWTVVLEKTLETPLDWKEIKPVHPKGNQSWIFIGRTDAEAETPTVATWCEELTPWKRPWCWQRLRAGREGDDRGWDGWMASPTRWTWVWANSQRWWWTGRPGVLQSMGSQSQTRLSSWTELMGLKISKCCNSGGFTTRLIILSVDEIIEVEDYRIWFLLIPEKWLAFLLRFWKIICKYDLTGQKVNCFLSFKESLLYTHFSVQIYFRFVFPLIETL